MSTAQSTPLSQSVDPTVVDLREPTPLQALAAVYADRLAAIGAGAGPTDLVLLDERIAGLESACFAEYGRARRPRLPDTSLYLG